MMIRIVAALVAALLACAPATAQDVRTLPLASTLTGSEKSPAVQGAGCPTKTTPCATVAVTPDLLRTYIGAAFQPKDTDLDAIAALTTTGYGRDLLTRADAAALRSYAGLGTIATQAASGVAITGGVVTGITDLAVADGGTGASSGAAARGNLGAAAAGANGDITSLTGLTTPLSVGQGGTGDTGSAWTSYTPTITSGTGSFTTVSATGFYKRLGKTVFVAVEVTIGNNGSAAQNVRASLPFTARGGRNQNMNGRENQVTGALLGGVIAPAISTDLMVVQRYDGQYPGASGYVLTISGFYEAA